MISSKDVSKPFPALHAIFAGTHGTANGLGAVLDAAAVLKERGRKDISIVLVAQGGEKQALKACAAEEKLDNVLFLNPVPKLKLAGLLAGADVGLQVLRNVPAFYYGTSPNKSFDYISFGLPVINNYPGWWADLIVEHDCGYTVAPAEPAAFAEALINACERRSSLRKQGETPANLLKSSFLASGSAVSGSSG